MTDLFRALKIEKNEEGQNLNIVEISEDDLMEGNVIVDVTHSTLNYKDGLAMTGSSPIVRSFPMIPGIDFSGVVRSSEDSKFSEGDRVVLNGYGLSESHYGGYSERARVNSKYLLKLPENISNHQAMQIGTAGYTAMLCVLGLEDFGPVCPKPLIEVYINFGFSFLRSSYPKPRPFIAPGRKFSIKMSAFFTNCFRVFFPSTFFKSRVIPNLFLLY